MTDSVMGKLALSNMPPAAKETQPRTILENWDSLYRCFMEYLAGDEITRRQQQVQEYIEEIHRLEGLLPKQEREYEIALLEWKPVHDAEEAKALAAWDGACESSNKYGYLITGFQHSHYIYTEGEVDYQAQIAYYSVKRTPKPINEADDTRRDIAVLRDQVQRLDMEIQEIRAAPDEIAKSMSWMEWFKDLDFEHMCDEIRRIEGAAGEKYVACLVEHNNHILEANVALLGGIKTNF